MYGSDFLSQRTIVALSNLFDEKWYRAKYPDVAMEGMDAIEHYLLHGAHELRNPSPWFDTYFYLSENRDVTEAGINPLVHTSFMVAAKDAHLLIRHMSLRLADNTVVSPYLPARTLAFLSPAKAPKCRDTPIESNGTPRPQNGSDCPL